VLILSPTHELVDIRTVLVDNTLPKRERIIEFLRQIRNPYCFKCVKFTITASYDATGPTFEECLHGLVAL
jgi:hypothetical protein